MRPIRFFWAVLVRDVREAASLYFRPLVRFRSEWWWKWYLGAVVLIAVMLTIWA